MALFNIPTPAQVYVKLAGYAAVAVIGAVVWNWTPFVGPAAVIARRDASIDKANDTIRKLNERVRVAERAVLDRDELLKANGKTASGEATDMARFMGGQYRSAFNAGYASKRCVGPDGAAVPDSGVQPDFAAVWADGAYKPAPPAARVPGVPKR